MVATVPGDAAALVDVLSAILRREDVAWDRIGVSADVFIAACTDQDLIGLVHDHVRGSARCDWPQAVRDEIATRARAEAAEELRRQQEIATVLDALAAADVQPILLKGTPLAYTVYASPALRPRLDTDLLVRHQDVNAIRRVLMPMGYAAPVTCDGELLFRQFTMVRADRFGVEHVLDFHWSISTQPAFAGLLTYDELNAGAAAVPALGGHARAAGARHALLLACIHPVMHHRNVERLLWVYDVHLLASRLSASEFDRFIDSALDKGIGPICAQQLRLARERFGTPVPDHAASRLGARGNPALSDYIRPGRRWHHEFTATLKGLHGWRARTRFLREVLFPRPQYMLTSYGYANRLSGIAMLPALYVHRNVYGLWKALVGRK